MNWFN